MQNIREKARIWSAAMYLSLDYRLWWITIWFGGCNMLIFIFLVFAKSFEILQWKFAVCTKICFPLVLLKSRSYQGYSQRNTVQPRFAKGVWSRKVLGNEKWKWMCKKEGCNLKQCFLFFLSKKLKEKQPCLQYQGLFVAQFWLAVSGGQMKWLQNEGHNDH